MSTEKTEKRQYWPGGPVLAQFLRDDALLCGIRGPYGSGKSVASIMKLLRNFSQQKPGPDGIIRRRTVIIRNTYPELGTTTIKTWHDWIPRTQGRFVEQGPPRHIITTPNSEWEVLFVALDKPADLQKLLSMDVSDAWINEAREIPKGILDGLTGRVGRFPRTEREGGRIDGKVLYTCAAPQIIMDTNPPDRDHWWGKMADFSDPQIEAQNLELEGLLRAEEVLRPDQKLQAFYAQPSGRSRQAENLMNLKPGYYLRMMAGKTEDWIKVYVDGEYGFIIDGRPIYPEYRDSFHCRDFSLTPGFSMGIGIDFGLTPAAVFAQRTAMGGWRIHSELVTEDMGAERFGALLMRVKRERYGDTPFEWITGDPAGDARSQVDERTPFDLLLAAGLKARPASTNDPEVRRATFASFLTKVIDGQPGMMIHPQCQQLRKALAGGYQYRKLQVAGEDRFDEKPLKNMSSHIAEAAQYLLLGAGEQRAVLRPHPDFTQNRPKFAEMQFAPGYLVR